MFLAITHSCLTSGFVKSASLEANSFRWPVQATLCKVNHLNIQERYIYIYVKGSIIVKLLSLNVLLCCFVYSPV